MVSSPALHRSTTLAPGFAAAHTTAIASARAGIQVGRGVELLRESGLEHGFCLFPAAAAAAAGAADVSGAACGGPKRCSTRRAEAALTVDNFRRRLVLGHDIALQRARIAWRVSCARRRRGWAARAWRLGLDIREGGGVALTFERSSWTSSSLP
eukprot:351161-Chlamydomonas_euryale.AAC.3